MADTGTAEYAGAGEKAGIVEVGINELGVNEYGLAGWKGTTFGVRLDCTEVAARVVLGTEVVIGMHLWDVTGVFVVEGVVFWVVVVATLGDK